MTQSDFNEFETKNEKYHFVTMTNYDSNFKNINVIFQNKDLKNTLGEILEKNDKTQLRIAETEKYPHVTFFFSGGREEPFKHEKRILKNSPDVATYDLKPEMSAIEITDDLLKEIKNQTNKQELKTKEYRLSASGSVGLCSKYPEGKFIQELEFNQVSINSILEELK